MTTRRQARTRPVTGPVGPAPILVALTAATALGATDLTASADPIDADALGRHVVHLSSSELEGRGLGTAALDAAAAYVETALREAGVAPVPGHDYRLSVPNAGDPAHPAMNVVAMVPGSASGHVLVGAHYDHLGVEEVDGERRVFPGADDNASGVAALLEIARVIAAREGAPGRSIVFAAFTGEESGLLGSTAYVESPPVPLDACVAMINLDTIGRLRDDRLVVFGTGTGDLFGDMLTGINFAFRFDLATATEGLNAGDHIPFFKAGIPTLHLFTDGHADYHRVTDTAEKVNVPGLARVAEFTIEILDYLADPSVTPRFVPAGAEKIAARDEKPRGRRRVSLGTIPDFSRESGGILVTGVLPGSAAADAGLAVGDVIVQLDDVAIDNLYDYQAALESHEPGDEVTITFLRDEERRMCRATLRKRGG